MAHLREVVEALVVLVLAASLHHVSAVRIISTGNAVEQTHAPKALSTGGRVKHVHGALPSGCPLTDESLNTAVKRFSRLLQFNTVSNPSTPGHVLHPEEFQALDAWLRGAYPEVFEAMQAEKVGEGGLSFLLTWQGSDPSLDPALFISHIDVVPVAEETLSNWTYPPFSGAVAEGYVWGRGAIDVKVGVAGLLEASTLLLRAGWAPQRTLMFAFGQDEEVGGSAGAALTADLLASRGTRLDIILDEGGSINVDGFPPYVGGSDDPGDVVPIALVGLAEKGYYSVQVHITTAGGHSSLPPIDSSSVGAIMGRILTALDRQPPAPALKAPVTDFLIAIAPHVHPPWLSGLFASPDRPGYAQRILEGHLLVDGPLTAALGRTTAAVTGVHTGVGDNVLPPSGTINVNFRLLPGDSQQDVHAYLEKVIGEDMRYVRLFPTNPNNTETASDVTPASGRHFAALKQAVQEIWAAEAGGKVPEVAPFLLTGGTDSKHYAPLSTGGVLRFVPTSMNRTAGDLSRVHGLNERLGVKDYGRAVCTYARILQLMAAKE